MNAIELCIAHVNLYRAIHAAPLITYSRNLEHNAQAWSNYMAATHRFEHSTGKYGENLAMMGAGTKNPCMKAVDMWYAEHEAYDYRQNKFIFNAGHFTQLVWKGTAEIGIGMATSDRGVTYVSMWYNPPGNVLGQFTKNVYPPVILQQPVAPPSYPPPLQHPFPPTPPLQHPFPPTPPLQNTFPPTQPFNGYIMEIKTKIKTCEDMPFKSCRLRYSNGSGKYYTVATESSLNVFDFRKYILNTLRHSFSQSETISLYNNLRTKIIYRVSGSSQSQE